VIEGSPGSELPESGLPFFSQLPAKRFFFVTPPAKKKLSNKKTG